MKKMAILTMTPDVIREVMGLPDGAIVTGIEAKLDYTGVIEVRVEGAGWPVREGDCIRRAAAGTFTKNEDEKPTLDWHLP